MSAILTVDDSIVTIMQIETIVKKFLPDVKIIKATNASEAQDLLESSSQDIMLALIDHNMEGIKGLDLMDILKKKDMPYEKMVLLTSNNREDLKNSVTEKNAHFLPKPLTCAGFEELLKKIA